MHMLIKTSIFRHNEYFDGKQKSSKLFIIVSLEYNDTGIKYYVLSKSLMRVQKNKHYLSFGCVLNCST